MVEGPAHAVPPGAKPIGVSGAPLHSDQILMYGKLLTKLVCFNTHESGLVALMFAVHLQTSKEVYAINEAIVLELLPGLGNPDNPLAAAWRNDLCKGLEQCRDGATRDLLLKLAGMSLSHDFGKGSVSDVAI